MAIELLLAAQFALIEREDPITREPQAFYGVRTEEGHVFGLVCKPGEDSIDVRLVPDRYRGPAQFVPLFQPRADSRFGEQEKAETDSWAFMPTYLSYTSSNLLRGVSGTASFIDQLAKDRTFNLRYEARPGRTETITINYELDREELRSFVGMCNPKRVIRRLQQIESPAAP